jgi:isovaleryl-CoA dehydrogenase
MFSRLKPRTSLIPKARPHLPYYVPQIRTMRVTYAPKEPPTPESAPVYERIAARRAPRPLIPLDLALLHNPAVADGWNSFIGAIRTQTTLDPAVRELSISRIAVLNHAVHEWNSHAPLALKAGVSKEGMETVFRGEVAGKDEGQRAGGGGLGEKEWAIVTYTDQMTRNVEVEEHVVEALKGHLSDREVVELTATVAAYNCVSRFLVALDVGESNSKTMTAVKDMEV